MPDSTASLSTPTSIVGARPPEPIASPASPDISIAVELDQILHNWQSRFTGGRSPSTVSLAFHDWAVHTANSPFQTASLWRSAADQWRRLARVALDGAPVIAPQSADRRFAAPSWSAPPYFLLQQAVLLGEEWWRRVVETPRGVSASNRRMVDFTVRQWLDLLSPSNAPFLNPEVVAATRARGGANFADGLGNFIRDAATPDDALAEASAFKVGKDLAATPGKVVYRNALIELIQYAPTTAAVGAQPVLIIPAWIMKYYILDLSPGNSLIRWLVAQGRTVFVISWRNPGRDLRDTSLDDYRSKGVMAAIDAVWAICDGAKIHATGYCLGGTLLAIAAAAMARDGDDRLASLSLFAAQTDFTEAGELDLFITEDQLCFLDDIMQAQGYLDSAQMRGAFQMLRSNDLVWSHVIRDYFLGEQEAPFDLMAWNADGTRLPARMHIEYLRELYLHNALAEGRFVVDGRPLELGDVRLPLFVVGTEHDHIAPWRSVFKVQQLNDGEVTFVLTSGGHNAGIVSEPGHPHRHFRMRMRGQGERTLGPDEWAATAPSRDGSWWVQWDAWLGARSKPRAGLPPMGASGFEALGDAPGRYVLEH